MHCYGLHFVKEVASKNCTFNALITNLKVMDLSCLKIYQQAIITYHMIIIYCEPKLKHSKTHSLNPLQILALYTQHISLIVKKQVQEEVRSTKKKTSKPHMLDM